MQFMGINWSDRSKDFAKTVNIPAGVNYNVSLVITPSEITTHDELRFRAKATKANATFYVDNWRLIEHD